MAEPPRKYDPKTSSILLYFLGLLVQFHWLGLVMTMNVSEDDDDDDNNHMMWWQPASKIYRGTVHISAYEDMQLQFPTVISPRYIFFALLQLAQQS